jgi:Sec-independent protein secretion pathway component TatC
MFYFKELFVRFQYLVFSFLITAFILYSYKAIIFILLTIPLIEFNCGQTETLNSYSNFIYTRPAELLTIHFFSIFLITIVTQVPYAFWHAVDFIRSSLFVEEYLKVIKILISLFIGFTAFNSLCFFFIFPKIWSFFQKFNSLVNQSENLNFSLELSVQDYFSFVLSFIYFVNVFIAIFYSLILLMLVFGVENFIYWKKLFIFINIVFATLLSPPDVYSQIVILIFLSALLELILFAFVYLSKVAKVYLIRHYVK